MPQHWSADAVIERIAPVSVRQTARGVSRWLKTVCNVSSVLRVSAARAAVLVAIGSGKRSTQLAAVDGLGDGLRRKRGRCGSLKALLGRCSASNVCGVSAARGQ